MRPPRRSWPISSYRLPDDIAKVGDTILGYLDPDANLSDDTDRARRRGIIIGRQRPDGMSSINGEINPALRALLDPFLAKYARPGVGNPADPDSPGIGDATPERIAATSGRDTRTTAQRTHDAFTLLLSHLVDPAALGSHRGMPVSVVFTMSLTDLEHHAGVATTASGGIVPLSDALRMAEKARPYLAVFDHAGLPLHLGRTRRLASPEQRLALMATLRGCSRPGCDAPATLCAVHHVRDYRTGGATDIENLVWACDHCHSLINDTPRGWKTILLDQDSEYPGRTAWIAPEHIDPTRTPRINHRHHADELLAEIVARIHTRKEHELTQRRQQQQTNDTAA